MWQHRIYYMLGAYVEGAVCLSWNKIKLEYDLQNVKVRRSD